MTDKARRQAVIVEALRERTVRNQEELRVLLARERIEATQATLSRDLREIGVVKTPEGYALGLEEAGAGRNERALERALRELLIAAKIAGNLVVLRTGPGRAQALSVELDRTPPEGVVGTVAGDDTIFVACATATIARETHAWFSEIAGL